MPRRLLRMSVADGAELRAGFAALRREVGVPESFPDAVLAEAETAARTPRLPEHDRTDLPFLTIDPPGSLDLDQALLVERRGSGYRVHYAIADPAAFVSPGGAVDREAHVRGETLYSPDLRTPLHPPVLGEGAASLLPGELRPAVLWTFDLDSAGEGSSVDVRRAVVRSRERLTYAAAQQRLEAGTDDEPLLLLREVGLLREERERDRGAVSLAIPEQEVVEAAGGWALRFRAPLPVEGWNAQVSLLTGMAAAELMLYGEVGVLRTLPEAPVEELVRLRRTAAALDIDWPEGTSYAEVVRALDPARPEHAAFLEEATVLLRGAGYTAFEGGVPEQATHAGVAAEYAHVTAPLRRLVDRYAAEACVALCAGAEVPEWARAGLPGLPAEMAAADRRASELERGCVSLVETVVLRDRVGEVFPAVVVDVSSDGGVVQLREPAVRARCAGDGLPLGQRVEVRLTEADPQRRTVLFELA